MKEYVVGFLFGLSAGGAIMWLRFVWYGIRKAQSKDVPDDWNDPGSE